MKKFNCNVIDIDFLSVEQVEQGVQKEDDDNFIDFQIYDDSQKKQFGVTLSLESTKNLIKELQKHVDENES